MPHRELGENFDINKIHTGGKYVPGRWSGFRKRGLVGALRKMKQTFRGRQAKNLSRADLEKFRNLLEPELKRLPRYSGGLNWWQKRRLKQQAWQMRKRGELSRADVKDFKKIINRLSADPHHYHQAMSSSPEPNYNSQTEINSNPINSPKDLKLAQKQISQLSTIKKPPSLNTPTAYTNAQDEINENEEGDKKIPIMGGM